MHAHKPAVHYYYIYQRRELASSLRKSRDASFKKKKKKRLVFVLWSSNYVQNCEYIKYNAFVLEQEIQININNHLLLTLPNKCTIQS